MNKVLLLLLVMSFGISAKNIASVKLVRGKVFVISSDNTKKQLKKNDWLNEGDTVQTLKRSFARLNFIDDSKVNVGPESQVKIERFKDDKPGVLSVVTGKIRAEISKDYLKMKKNKSKLFVKSNAAVMGIRGTDFLFSKDSDDSTTAVLFEGSVVFNKLNSSDQNNFEQYEAIVDKGFKLKPGDFSTVGTGVSSPTQPKKLDKVQFIKLKNNSGLSNKTRSVVPSGLDLKTVKKDSEQAKSSAPFGQEGSSGAEGKKIKQIPLPAGVNYRPSSFLNDRPNQEPGPKSNRRRVDVNVQD